jgi:hypothetical protein
VKHRVLRETPAPPLTDGRGTPAGQSGGPVTTPAMLDEAGLLNFVIASGNA